MNATLPASEMDTITYRAAGLYVATAAYEAALRRTSQDAILATLDRMCETVAEIMPAVVEVVDPVGGAEFAEALRAFTVAPMLAFAAIERARAEVGDEVGYVLDILVHNLKAGADPRAVRRDALAVPARLRDLAEADR